MNYGITFRDPTADTTSTLRERAAPLDTITDKVIALMDIGKMRGDEFIDRLEQLCAERGIKTRRYKKPTNTRVAPREMIKDIADNCDAVIIALSDCGSSTSCSTHDLNDLD
jgi:aspartate aminotransferase-like enzyme